MTHTTELSRYLELNKTLTQNQFYKAPLPMLIGNLPFGPDFKENRHQYEYLDYYIVAAWGTTKFPIVYYNKFFQKYTCVVGDYASWSNLYPKFSINGQIMCLNPFVNAPNGACAWIAAGNTYSGQKQNTSYDIGSDLIYYNFAADRYEYGLGEDVNSYNDTYYYPPIQNFNNGKAVGKNDLYLSVNVNYAGLKNYDLATPTTSVWNKGYKCEFVPTEGSQFNFGDLTDRNNFGQKFDKVVLNEAMKKYNNGAYATTTPCQLIFETTTKSTEGRYHYERLDLVPDLNHEADPEKYEEICGVYENNNDYNNSTLDAFFLGSMVFGNRSHEELGWFIGINEGVDESNLYSSSDGQKIDYYHYQNSNVTLIQKNRSVKADWSSSTYRIDLNNFDALVTLGVSLDETDKKYLVYYLTYNTEGLFKKFRLFIVDKDPSLIFSQRKIWYADIPVDDSNTPQYRPPSLFRYPCMFVTYTSEFFTELEFNYVNLDDENDVKESVKFELIGAVRENAYEKIIGIPVRKQYLENKNWTPRGLTNIYVGYWDAPIVNFEEENE